MTTIISGNTPSTIGNDTTISGDITADNLPTNGSIVGYQQGVWTPVTGQGAAEVITNNVWWRIGNTVGVQAKLASFNNSSPTVIAVTGTPYAPFWEGAGAAMSNKFNTPIHTSFITQNSSGTISFFKSGADKNSGWAQVAYVDRLDASSAIWFSLTYLTDDTTWTPINGATVS